VSREGTVVATREKQLAYSDLQPEMHAEDGRRKKAQKIIRVVGHYLGRDDLTGLRVLDLGCSTGYIADELHAAGGSVTGVDIDQPGLAGAQERFASRVPFLCADGEQLPFPDETFDLIVFNQIYEHVVDPDAVMDEIRRVLAPGGVVYLGLGNKRQIVEPHYKLPLLSWLPQDLADKYMQVSGKGDKYYERFRTLRGLGELCHDLVVWDYTWTVLAEPLRFAADDMVPSRLAGVSPKVWKALEPIIPGYIWLGTKRPAEEGAPAGAPVQVPPRWAAF
jgi:ubiquinone/menaquinone biosynthesis C-methylase UbiE